MASKKQYTEVDKKTFLGILKKFSYIVENKKSDASTLKNKQDAWQEIMEQYNISTVISSKRSVAQLKKIWSNMKSTQRDAIMKEKQSRMATGGGPAESSSEIDPQVAEIVPTLMQTAPSVFSSNFAEEDLANRRDLIFDDEYMLVDMTEVDDGNNKTSANKNNCEDHEEAGHCSRIYKDPNEGHCSRMNEIDEIVDDTLLRRRSNKKGSTISAAPRMDFDERRLKVERYRRIMRNEEDLADLKRGHEEQKNKLEIEFLKAKYALEIRAATAAAEKAELQLRKERETNEHTYE